MRFKERAARTNFSISRTKSVQYLWLEKLEYYKCIAVETGVSFLKENKSTFVRRDFNENFNENITFENLNTYGVFLIYLTLRCH